MTYKSDNEKNNIDDNGILNPSPKERVQDALFHVKKALNETSIIDEIVNIDPEVRRAREAAIAYLSYGPKSSGKVRDKLLQKGFDKDLSWQTTRDLVREGYIDDSAVAKKYLSERTGSKAEGYKLAKKRLIAFGIPTDIAEDTVIHAAKEVPEILLLAQYLRARYKKELILLRDGDKELDREHLHKVKAKLFRAAERKGFSYHDAKSLFEQWGI